MSIQAKIGKIGIPVVLLHESEALLVTVELKTGDVARGWLMKAEDCWNMQLKDVTLTDHAGNDRQLKTLYIRGDRINFVVLPDILSESPMFHRLQEFKRTKGRKGGNPQGLSQGKKIVLLKARQKKMEEDNQRFMQQHNYRQTGGAPGRTNNDTAMGGYDR
jgi:small nuclear ribonucleoprotein D3